MLDGKKTYIIAIGIVAAAAGAFMQGQIDLATALNQVLTGLGFAALRYGVANK